MARAKDALITRPPRIPAEETAPTAIPMSAPLRILYVEDNVIVREITSELLAQDRRQIVSCATAEEALKAFAANPFDLVITDVSLPAMSGIELARSILALKPRMPIILATGYDLDFAVENWGANVRSIIKPFDAAEIEALMSELKGGAEAS
jgi:two-component system cell cycle response regulator CpdR